MKVEGGEQVNKRKRLDAIVKFFSLFYFDKLIRGTRYFFRLVSSEAYRRKLNAGEDLYIFTPISLIGSECINIGRSFHARSGLILHAWTNFQGEKYNPKIVIGDNVSLGFDCHIGAINYIEIGNNVLMGSKIYITDHYHGKFSPEEKENPPAKRKLYSKGSVIIGDNVWIGDNVSIMPGVTIGKGAVIGANAVVTKDVEKYQIAAGVPAKIIKQL